MSNGKLDALGSTLIEEESLSYRRILRLWFPLAATWLMMSVEGPFLAALIARLPDPTYNLAAYGVSLSFAIIVEAPVIMILSASTALVDGRDSFEKLRRFTFTLNLIISATMILLVATPLFDWITLTLMGLPEPVSSRIRISLWILLPWPAAIGYRRFYQGLMIRSGRTRQVAYGTMIRVVSMAVCALSVIRWVPLEGAYVGAIALSIGVVLEAIATGRMARVEVDVLNSSTDGTDDTGHTTDPAGLTYAKIIDFYMPLAMTSVIALAIQPTVTFFIGNSRMGIESLAVLPVISSLTFVFRSLGMGFQEVAIANLDGNADNLKKLMRFAFCLAVAAGGGLMLVAFTPLSMIWFRDVSGLSQELAEFSIVPLRLFSAIPILSVLMAMQRAFLVVGHRTRPITVATITELVGVITLLYLCVHRFELAGAVAAVTAMILGRTISVAMLVRPVRRVVSTSYR